MNFAKPVEACAQGKLVFFVVRGGVRWGQIDISVKRSTFWLSCFAIFVNLLGHRGI